MDVSYVSQRILSNIIQQLNVDYEPDKYLLVRVRIIFIKAKKSVSIKTAYEQEGLGSIPNRDKTFFFTPQSPDRLWGPTSLLFNWCRGLITRGKAAGASS
jgi:hypothetical protein